MPDINNPDISYADVLPQTIGTFADAGFSPVAPAELALQEAQRLNKPNQQQRPQQPMPARESVLDKYLRTLRSLGIGASMPTGQANPRILGQLMGMASGMPPESISNFGNVYGGGAGMLDVMGNQQNPQGSGLMSTFNIHTEN